MGGLGSGSRTDGVTPDIGREASLFITGRQLPLNHRLPEETPSASTWKDMTLTPAAAGLH